MDFFSPALLNMRFMKTQWKDRENLTLDANMIRILVSIDEQKTVSQICNEAGVNLPRFRESLYELWRSGLIVPVNGYFICRCHQLIEQIVQHRSKGNPAVAKSIKAKLHLKGIDPNRFYPGAFDDPVVLKRLTVMARNLGITGPVVEDSREAEPTRGMTRLIIDSIITQRAQGNPDIARNLRAKLILKGINPQEYTYDSVDDPEILAKTTSLARKMGVSVEKPAPPTSKGKIHRLIRAVIDKRARGNPVIEKIMRAKFMLKGINLDHYRPDTVDDPAILSKMETVAKSYGVQTESLSPVAAEKTRGRVKYIMQAIIDQKSRGNLTTAKMISDKFRQKGLDPEKFSETTEDNPMLVKKLEALAAGLKVTL